MSVTSHGACSDTSPGPVHRGKRRSLGYWRAGRRTVPAGTTEHRMCSGAAAWVDRVGRSRVTPMVGPSRGLGLRVSAWSTGRHRPQCAPCLGRVTTMLDPLSLAVGGVLLAAGWFMGRVSRRHTRAAASSVPAVVCSCGHGYGGHTQGGQCRAEVRRLRNGCTGTYDWVACPCLTYDGPEPLPRVWTELGGTDA